MNAILINLISDAIFLSLLIILGWLIVYFSHRLMLLKFFGLVKSRRIVIYLSNLRIKQFGAIGIDGKDRSYKGSAGGFKEIQAANRFGDLFNYFLPSLSDKPGILSKLLVSDIPIQILLSPLAEGEIEKSNTIITLGSPAYNIVSRYVESKIHSKARFELGVSGKTEIEDKISGMTTSSAYTQVTSSEVSPNASGTASAYDDRLKDSALSRGVGLPATSSDKNHIHETESAILIEGLPPITGSQFGFVECIHDKDNDRKVFYVAGISEEATAGATNFLIDRWSSLQKKPDSEKGFLVMLRLEPPNYRNPTIIFER